MLSVFDIFSIGIGPSSSHTIGPMRAVSNFLHHITEHKKSVQDIATLHVDLYGSLSLTGLGHGTHKAILWGFMGFESDTINPLLEQNKIDQVYETKQLFLDISDTNIPEPHPTYSIPFDMDKDITYHTKSLKGHSNALTLTVCFHDQTKLTSTYYSVGGGFIIEKGKNTYIHREFPNIYHNAQELISLSSEQQKPIWDIVMNNECTLKTTNDITIQLHQIWDVMNEAIEQGLHSTSTLPGPLKLARRAHNIYTKAQNMNDNYFIINAYAIAVAEENAAGHRIVTSPTNGASGVIPAIIKYYINQLNGSKEGVKRLFLTCTAIGILFKLNASISGAEVGCQGEIGVAASMAAGGLVAALQGTTDQIVSAAEIAMEHHLGLVCDPVGGFVQIPCIERNAAGSVAAYNAARLALIRDKPAKVSLDQTIKAMYAIGKDMKDIYRETARGGLAKFVPC